jgi:AcrR family transcriptional regulator
MPTKKSIPPPAAQRPRVRRGSAADADRLRGELVDAALALFMEDGLEAVTMRAVATRVGVSAMTPYRYFEDKGHLLRGIWQHMLGTAWQAMIAAAQGLPHIRDRIRAQVNAFIDYWEDNPQHYRLVYMTEQTTRFDEQGALTTLPIYASVIDASLGASRDLATEVGGDPAHAKLASDVRFMMVSGYLHARLVNRRYPWTAPDVLRPAFVELIIEAMTSCLRDGPRKAPAPAPARKRAKPAVTGAGRSTASARG